ncbi:hypothetical protein AGDE_16804 [Angomonas deanei]|nr:hypothetical protein AGDE_16804 [Angomonas deanei]|eukprot:EPY16157.1 hypothetical protein AGDE_16804 [Angomonas deanei]
MGHLPHTRSFLQLTSLKNGTVICVGGRSLRDPNSEQNEKYKKNETAILTMTSSHYHAFLQEEDHNNNNNSKACCWETVEWINTTKNEYYFPHSLHQCVVDVTSKDVLVILTENEPNYVSNNHKNENNNEDDHEDSRSSCTPLPCTHLQLFLVEFSDSNNYNNKQKASWREVILQLGSIPYSIRGASLHIISNLIHHNNSNSHETDFSIYLFGSYNNFNANGSLEMLTDKKKLKEYYFKSEKERQVNLPIRIRYEE